MPRANCQSDSFSVRLQVLRNHLRNSVADSCVDQCGRCQAQQCKASTPSYNSKVVSAEEAVSGIKDGAVVTTGGFVGCGSPEHIIKALRQRFESSAHPSNLHLFEVAVTGNRKGRGVNELAVEGLVSKFTFGWTGNCPDLIRLIQEDKIQAWNLPLGAVSHMIRDAAAGKPGPILTVGLGTFVDPREQGGKLNSPSQPDMVEVVSLGGKEYLWYKAPRIDVAILRGSTADTDGNVSFERECFYADALNQAIAAHNSRGLVIVQVERLVERGSIPSRAVHLPAALVDKVVLAPPELHWQSMASAAYDGSLSGEVRRPLSGVQPLPLDARKVIAHRCMLELATPHAIVNLGVGMPEGVAVVVNTHATQHCPHILPVTLSTEVGMMGGIPAGGQHFGAAYNPDSVMPTSTMIDLIQGGGLDATVLGCAEVDEWGNVNVSKFGGRHPGCGGFIDISQSAKLVMFAGTFTSSGLQIGVEDGKLQIVQEGKLSKFRKRVQEKTFVGTSCNGRKVLYITERCVFRLLEVESKAAVELIEIAPGVRLQEDILAHMEFVPVMNDVKLMDERCFLP